jgi:CDP-paratose synthetase
MKVLFLGGTSYLGKEIIKRLEDLGGYEITVIRRDTPIVDIEQQDIVFNLVVDYGKNDKPLAEVMAVNVDYPLEKLKQIKFKTVINFSTALGKEVSHYAYSKKVLEEKLFALDGQVINLRLQHFYGPGTPEQNFVTYLVTKMLKGEDVPLTDCQQKRDFVYLEDLLNAVQLIVEKRDQLGLKETLEIGSGVAVKLQDFVEEIKRLSKSKSQLLFGTVLRRANEPEELKADITKLKALGWEPRVSVTQGLGETVKYFSRDDSGRS